MWSTWNKSIFGLTLYVCLQVSWQSQLLSEFLEFVKRFNKSYEYGSREFYHHFHAFQENLQMSRSLNQKHNDSTTLYGVTKFSDLTPQEFKKKYLTDLKLPHPIKFSNPNTHKERFKSLGVPLKHDWRNFNNRSYVSPVRNQRSCGGCWAFSTVEIIETRYAIQKNEPTPELSVQEVIDCSEWNAGCRGGDTCLAMEWMTTSHVPLVTSKLYPLTDKSDSCKTLPKSPLEVRLQNYTCSGFVNNEDEMIRLLYNVGPLAVSVDATSWNNYMGGIIQYHCEYDVNHAVDIVGYDLTGDVPYYIVRNSWGTDFGIDGYLYIKIGENLCNIAGHVAYVSVQ